MYRFSLLEHSIQSCTYVLFHYFLAPDDPPVNFIGSVINSTTLLLTWSEPLFPNGIIISYSIMYNLSGISQLQTVFSNNIIITGLDAYTVYKFTVLASTRIGPGPTAEFEARTMESSKRTQLLFDYLLKGQLMDTVPLYRSRFATREFANFSSQQ